MLTESPWHTALYGNISDKATLAQPFLNTSQQCYTPTNKANALAEAQSPDGKESQLHFVLHESDLICMLYPVWTRYLKALEKLEHVQRRAMGGPILPPAQDLGPPAQPPL